MKNKAFQIFSFIFLLYVVDHLVGAALKELYFSQKVGTAGQLNYTMLEAKEDIIILGNSRAQHHYNNKIIKDSTGMSCYNGGLDGGYGIWLPYAITDAILKRYMPKLIIIEFNPAWMEYSKLNYEKLAVLLPYKDRFDVCNKLVSQRGDFEKFKWVSSIYPFNSMVYALTTNKLFENRLKHVMGFMPIREKTVTGTTDISLIKFVNDSANKPDILNMNAISSLIQVCVDKKVKLLFVNSPIYNGKFIQLSNQTDVSFQSVTMIKNAGFQYIDFSSDRRMVTNQDFFVDQKHLNEKGANYFSSFLINYIKSNKDLQAAVK